MTDAALPTPASELITWYDVARRDLPWRRTRDPWSILVSEVMLQQTRVETVIPYYLRFLARFPTPAALAAAPLDEVLALWAGLGYYRRARLLKQTAQAVAARPDGAFPRDAASLAKLPGIGPYTAGALASIAFDAVEPLVDGNVARVLARLFRIEGDPRSGAARKAVWATAAQLLPRERPGDFNQALMELGATLCLPANPRCSACPLAHRCEAHRHSEVDRYPTPRPRPTPLAVRIAVGVVDAAGSIAVLRRREGGRMAGLHDLPSCELRAGDDAAVALSRHLAADHGIATLPLRAIGTTRHAITHHRITLEVMAGAALERTPRNVVRERAPDGGHDAAPLGLAAIADERGIEFVTRERLAELGLAAIGRKALAVAAKARPDQ
jgi:A/G-specific adenine glycosylase